MTDMISALFVFLTLVLFFRGAYIFWVNRADVKEVYGFRLTSEAMMAGGIISGISLSLFTVLFVLNWYGGYLEVASIRMTWKIFFNIPSYFFAAFYEEGLFRLLIISALATWIQQKWVWVAVSSLFFAAFHFPEGYLLWASYLLGGMIYAGAYLRFQNFWVAVVLHFTWNAVQGLVYGFPVSGQSSESIFTLVVLPDQCLNGGDIGLEGSVGGLIIRLLILLCIFILPRMVNDRFLQLTE